MKICVYAICKNEEKFVEKWLKSMDEADYICVLDTGSTDNTVKFLRQNPKVILGEKIISPFRFDVARNESLKLIPQDTDFCVCTDLDENFEAGWREKLEKGITKRTNQVQYRYTWSFNPDGSEGVVFYADKIHKYGEFYWKHPVHEIITPLKPEKLNITLIKDLQLNHYPDSTKSRGQYLPLLELSVKEEPNNDRNMHYLGREYFFHKKYKEAIETLNKHLALPTAVWKEERSSSYRYIAQSYWKLGEMDNAEKNFKLSILETPASREPYYQLGVFYYSCKRFLDAIVVLKSMENISNRQLNYISNPECWDWHIEDLLSLCYYELGDNLQAFLNSRTAVAKSPNNARLKDNLKFFEDKLTSSK